MSLADTYKVPWQVCYQSSWQAVQAKFAFNIVLGKMLQPRPERPSDISVPYLKALNVQWGKVVFDSLPEMWASGNEVEQLNLKINDLLVCEGGEVGRSAMVTEVLPENCIFQNALHRVRPSERGNTRYLYYCLKVASEAGWFDVICNRATIAHFTVEKFRELKIHLPLNDQQEVIANYLDRETAHIDALIAEKERMLALLEEKRAALISQAVTRGLDPDVPLKPSGLDRLGDAAGGNRVTPTFSESLPPEWVEKRLKYAAPLRIERVEATSEHRKYLGLENIQSWTGKLLPTKVDESVARKDSEGGNAISFQKDDVLFGKLRPYLAKAFHADKSGFCSTEFLVLKPQPDLHPEFLLYSMLSPEFVGLVNASTFGAKMPRANWDFIGSMSIPVPDLDIQQRIANYLDRETAHIDTLVAEIERTLALLEEKRSALITAAVTGQLTQKDMAA